MNIFSSKAPENKELLLFQKTSGVVFKNIGLLKTALTHSSYASEHNCENNERLEFLGDSILSISVSTYLFNNFSLKEGDYSRIRAYVVSEKSLAVVAKKLKINEFIYLGNGVKVNDSVLADATEAFFAAIYLDKGFEKARKFIVDNLKQIIKNTVNRKEGVDFKSELQFYAQKKFKGEVPKYEIISSRGPEHNKEYDCTVSIHNRKFGPGTGRSIKEAEKAAASIACLELGIIK